MKEYSIIIPTFQGASSIVRLVRSICDSANALSIQQQLEIVVVIDGSTDDTYDLLSTINSNVTLQIIKQQNAGLAQTRNRGIAAATGNLLWHLDDDMEVDSNCMTQHLLRKRETNELRVGSIENRGDPTLLFEHVRGFYEQRHTRLLTNIEIREPMDFTCSNTSGIAKIFKDFPFNSIFNGYGMEDCELASRMLRGDVLISYDPHAKAVHHYDHTLNEFYNLMYEEGKNRVQLCQLHPHLFEQLFKANITGPALLLQQRAFRGDLRLLKAVHACFRYSATNGFLSNSFLPAIVQRKLFQYTVISARYAGIADACASLSNSDLRNIC